MTSTTKTTTSFLTKLGKVKGIGPATIAKLQQAEMDSAEKIREIGRQGLSAVGMTDKIASILIDALPEAPAPKPERKAQKQPAAKPVPQTAMAAAFAKAEEKGGRPVAEIRQELAAVPAPAPQPVVEEKKPEEPVMVTFDLTGHVRAGKTAKTIRNPLQLRPFAAQINFQLPKDYLGFTNLRFADAQHKVLDFNKAWVIQVIKKDGGSNMIIVSGDDVELTYATLTEKFAETATVKKMWLRKAIDKLFTIFRQKAEAAEAAKMAKLLEAEMGAVVPNLVSKIGKDPRGQYWLTEADVANTVHPLDLPRVESLVDENLRKAMKLGINEGQKTEFNRRFEAFMVEYHRRLDQNFREITGPDDHSRLVRGVQGFAGQAKRYPDLDFTMVRFYFRSINEVRYLVVPDSIVDEFKAEFARKFNMKLRDFNLLLDWLGIRGRILVGDLKDKAEAAARAKFETSKKGKAVLAAFDNVTSDGDEDDLADFVL